MIRNPALSGIAGIVVVCLATVTASADLIGVVDHSDTFTVGLNGRTDGYYIPAGGTTPYDIEYTRSGLITPRWAPLGTQTFSFNSSATTIPGYGWTTSGNSGAAAGVAQTGGGESGITYGQRSDFVVQSDYATSTGTYYDLWSGDGTGKNTLYVLFRKGDSGIAVGYVDAAGAYSEASTGLLSGIGEGDASWHNTAVRFNKDANSLGIYIDSSLKGTLNLTSLAGGAFAGYATSHVGFGGDTEDNGGLYVTWIDNFRVGSVAPVPEPSACVVTLTAVLGILAYAWRRRK